MRKDAVSSTTLARLVAEGLTVRQIAARVDRSVAVTRRLLLVHGLRTERASRRHAPAEQDILPGRCDRHGDVLLVRRSDSGWQCRTCRSDAVARRRRKLKRLLVDEAGGACVLCGYDRCVTALEFHHIDPATKRFGLANAGLTRSLDRLREEAAKCVLVCSNCHAEIESGMVTLGDVQTVRVQDTPVAADPSLDSPLAGAG